MSIILCGLPASGKTTIGKLLAKKLNQLFVDTDRLIENLYAIRHGKQYTCRQIFTEEGEASFRQIEKSATASLQNCTDSIIALGGGTLSDPDNVKILQSIGFLVYLKTPPIILWQRIKQGGIPPYLLIPNPARAFYDMIKKREPVYAQSAHHTIETKHLNAQELCRIIHSEIFLRLRHGASLMENQSVWSLTDVQQA